MAGLTKEQIKQKKIEEEAKLRDEIEAKLREEMEAEYAEKISGSEAEQPTKKKGGIKKIPLDLVVPVICNTAGGASYISKRQGGYIVEWDDIGGIEYMELSELQSMRNTDRRFFEDSWIVVSESEDRDGNIYSPTDIYEFLRVGKYYENIYTPETIEELFEKSATEILRDVTPLSKGMKSTIATVAKRKLDEETLDLNLVNALEQSLEIQFSL